MLEESRKQQLEFLALAGEAALALAKTPFGKQAIKAGIDYAAKKATKAVNTWVTKRNKPGPKRFTPKPKIVRKPNLVPPQEVG